jgi:hypothetical protein
MIPLTEVAGVPDRARVRRGMAYFEGTGPEGKTCGDCGLKNYWRISRNDKRYRWPGCAKFKQLSGGKHGPTINKNWQACKYFQPKTG